MVQPVVQPVVNDTWVNSKDWSQRLSSGSQPVVKAVVDDTHLNSKDSSPSTASLKGSVRRSKRSKVNANAKSANTDSYVDSNPKQEFDPDLNLKQTSVPEPFPSELVDRFYDSTDEHHRNENDQNLYPDSVGVQREPCSAFDVKVEMCAVVEGMD